MFTEWLASGERGISSEAIVSHLTGARVGRNYGFGDHPYDPGDFRRCEKLLRQVPFARVALPQMATRSPEWAALVDHWEELVALMEEEAPGVFDNCHGSAPRTYARMQALFEEVRS
jgi:hypothetical protein